MTTEGIQSFLTQIELPGFKFSAAPFPENQTLIEVKGPERFRLQLAVSALHSRTQIVNILFHQIREELEAQLRLKFRYRGRPIFVDIDVDKLWEACDFFKVTKL